MTQLHERMPVILEGNTWPLWLGEGGNDWSDLMRPAADDVLRLWAVSRAVNNVRNNEPDLLDRIEIRMLDRQAMRRLDKTRPDDIHRAVSMAGDGHIQSTTMWSHRSGLFQLAQGSRQVGRLRRYRSIVRIRRFLSYARINPHRPCSSACRGRRGRLSVP